MFRRYADNRFDPNCCFSIYFGRRVKSLDLVSNNAEEVRTWVTGLKYLMAGISDEDSLARRQRTRDQYPFFTITPSCVGSYRYSTRHANRMNSFPHYENSRRSAGGISVNIKNVAILNYFQLHPGIISLVRSDRKQVTSVCHTKSLFLSKSVWAVVNLSVACATRLGAGGE